MVLMRPRRDRYRYLRRMGLHRERDRRVGPHVHRAWILGVRGLGDGDEVHAHCELCLHAYK